MKKIDGYEFEHQCAALLKRRGFSQVTVTQSSNDQGIDIIAFKNGKKYGVQCKYYSSPVGNKAVQEAFSGAKYYNCDVAVVMSNNIFTKSAEELADKTGVLLWESNTVKSDSRILFKIVKIANIFIILIGILAFLLSHTIENLKYPMLQKVEFTFMILGGLFGIYGWNFRLIEFLSILSYVLTIFFSIIIGLLLNSRFSLYTFIFSIPIFLSGIRVWQLRN